MANTILTKTEIITELARIEVLRVAASAGVLTPAEKDEAVSIGHKLSLAFKNANAEDLFPADADNVAGNLVFDVATAFGFDTTTGARPNL